MVFSWNLMVIYLSNLLQNLHFANKSLELVFQRSFGLSYPAPPPWRVHPYNEEPVSRTTIRIMTRAPFLLLFWVVLLCWLQRHSMDSPLALLSLSSLPIRKQEQNELEEKRRPFERELMERFCNSSNDLILIRSEAAEIFWSDSQTLCQDYEAVEISNPRIWQTDQKTSPWAYYCTRDSIGYWSIFHGHFLHWSGLINYWISIIL